MTQLDAKAQELGSIGAALQWARDNGYTVDTSTELPPLPGQQPVYEQPTGGLAQAGAPDVQNDLNTAEAEDGADLGMLAGQDIDFSKLNDPVMFGNLYRQTLAQQQAYEKSAAERFEAAKARLNQRYAGPSQADQLFSLSRALLSPRKTPGFAGTLQQVVGSFDDVSKAQRQAQIAREEQLAALQEQYEQGRYQRGAAGTKNITDLLKTYATINKKPTSTSAPVWMGPDMKLRSKATGSVISEPPQAAVQTLQQYLLDPNNTPANKMVAKRNFDSKFGLGAADIFGGV